MAFGRSRRALILPLAATLTVGKSSLMIVPVAVAEARVAFVGFDRANEKDSSVSTKVSPTTFVVTVLDVSPGAKVTVSFAAV